MHNRDSIRENSPAPPNGNSLPAPPPAAGRILVVDDDEDLRGMLAEYLRGTGYEVRCVEDGEAGWSALSSGNYDLLITDHEMPRLTGGDLLLRARAASIVLPVILISGKLVWPDADLLHVLPPGAAVEKPFLWTDLLAQVRRFLPAHTSTDAPPVDLAGQLDERRLARSVSGVRRRKSTRVIHP